MLIAKKLQTNIPAAMLSAMPVCACVMGPTVGSVSQGEHRCAQADQSWRTAGAVTAAAVALAADAIDAADVDAPVDVRVDAAAMTAAVATEVASSATGVVGAECLALPGACQHATCL